MGKTSDILRDYYYVDDQMVDMYFTQLPHKARARFHQEYGMIVQPKFKASFSPSFESSRDKLEAPYNKVIAQLHYVEEHIRATETLGTLKTLQGKFISDSLNVKCASVTTPRGALLFAFPAEGAEARRERFARSYTLLGDLDKCMHAMGRPPDKTPDSSTLSRVTSVWDYIYMEKSKSNAGRIRPSPYLEHTDRRPGVVRALFYMEKHLNDSSERTFSGIMKVRERFTVGTQEHVVLYPLYLEVA